MGVLREQVNVFATQKPLAPLIAEAFCSRWSQKEKAILLKIQRNVIMETVKERESTAKKQKGGRPKKVIKKSVFLMVRLTVAELLMIQGRAREAGLKPSEWFRQAARKAAITPRLSPEEMGWFRDLSGMTNNLNQLTRLAHQQGLISLSADIRKALDKTDVLIEKLMGDDR